VNKPTKTTPAVGLPTRRVFKVHSYQYSSYWRAVQTDWSKTVQKTPKNTALE
jgi:hypothetical protein